MRRAGRDENTIDRVRRLIYTNRTKWLIALTIIFTASFAFSAWKAGGTFSEKIYEMAAHICATAIVLVAIEFFVGGFDRYNEEARAEAAEDNLEQTITETVSSALVPHSNILRALELRVREATPAVFTDEHDKLFRYTLPMVSGAKSYIWVTAHTYTPRAPAYWFDALIERLKESASLKQAVEYRVKMFIDFKNITPDILAMVEDRTRRQSEHGVDDQVRVEFIDANGKYGFDVMIIDGKHVAMRFCMNPGATKDSNFGVTFDDSPSLAAAVTRWYGNLPSGIDLIALRRTIGA
jgi:hypothetical protein